MEMSLGQVAQNKARIVITLCLPTKEIGAALDFIECEERQ